MNAEEGLNFIINQLQLSQEVDTACIQLFQDIFYINLFKDIWNGYTYREMEEKDNNYRFYKYRDNYSDNLLPLLRKLNLNITHKTHLKSEVEQLWRKSHNTLLQPDWKDPLCTCTLEKHEKDVSFLAISPNGTNFASSGLDKKINVYKLTGEYQYTLSGHSHEVTSVIFLDDKTLISSSYDMEIKLWCLETGELLHTLWGDDYYERPLTLFRHSDWIECIAISPDRQVLACGSLDSTIHILDINRREEVKNSIIKNDAKVISLIFNHDNYTLLSGDMNGNIKFWNLKHPSEPLHTINSQQEWVVSLAIIETKLFSGGKHGDIKIWDLATKQLYRSPKGHLETVFSLAVNKDGKTLASGSWDNTIKIWNWDSDNNNMIPVKTLDGHSSGVRFVTFSPDGKILVSGDAGGIIKIWRPFNLIPSENNDN